MARKVVREDRRIQIMEGLGKCLLKKSFRETSIKDIAKEAGITHGVLHYYFKSKNDILLNFIDYTRDKFLTDEAEWFSPKHLDNIPKDELLEEVLQFNLDLILNHRDNLRTLVEVISIAKYDKAVEKKLKDFFKRVEEIEIGIFLRTGIDRQTAAVISKAMIALFSGLSVCKIALRYKDAQIKEMLQYIAGSLRVHGR